MELIIKQMTLPGAIEFNFEELKSELADKVEYYKNLAYTENEIKDAKKDLAELRKFTKLLNDERIAVKKNCLKPYEAFEKKVKELEAIVNDPINVINTQVKEYEDMQKHKKAEEIAEIWESIKDKPDWLNEAHIFDNKWLNASVTLKAIEKDMQSKIDKINSDISAIGFLPEFGFEALEVYKECLDIEKAIAEGKRLSEIQKMKLEAETKKVEVEIKPTVETEEIEEDFIPSFDDDIAIWRSYKVKLTPDQVKILENYFATSGIEFERC